MSQTGSEMGSRPEACILASERAWGHELFFRLQRKALNRWTLVAKPAELASLADAVSPRFIFFPHWSSLIPEAVWSRHECVIFHMTDLPYGRGGSPLQNLIVRGHNDTVVTAIRCTGELDSGPVYMKRPLSLHGSAREIFARSMTVIEAMIAELVAGAPEPQPQLGEVVRFLRRTPDQSRIDDLHTVDAVYDHIRMLDADGYPRAFLEVGGLRLEFDRAARTADGVEARVRFRCRGPAPPDASGGADGEQ